MSPASSWLSRTGQSWKLHSFVAATLVAAGLFVAAMAVNPGLHPSAFIGLLVGGTALAAAAFLWFTLAIRCAACGARVAWWAVRTKKSSAWYVALVGLKACPICGKAPA